MYKDNNMQDEKLLNDIRVQLNNIKIFDTHEHLVSEKQRRKQKLDFFLFFLHYTSSDLISSGMCQEDVAFIQDPDNDIERRWSLFEPHWKNIKNTMYSNNISEMIKNLFGVGDINLISIKLISDKLEKSKDLDYYNEILAEKANIKYIINDMDWITWDKKYNIDKIDYNEYKYTGKDIQFLPVIRLDDVLLISSMEEIWDLEKKYDIKIHSFYDFLKLIDKIFTDSIDFIYGYKIGVAYYRSLLFEETSYYKAEKEFISILDLEKYSNASDKDFVSKKDLVSFQNYIFRYAIEKAIEFSLPVQIHTGLLGGNRNKITNSDPVLLNNLFLPHRNARFDIFHIGYPFTDELITMVKCHPNLYIDMCWVPVISSTLYKETLDLLIKMVPSNKIFGFGGDYVFAEGVYGAQMIARDSLIEVLYKKIQTSCFTPEEGMDFAYRILYQNPYSVYLSKKRR